MQCNRGRILTEEIRYFNFMTCGEPQITVHNYTLIIVPVHLVVVADTNQNTVRGLSLWSTKLQLLKPS